MVLAESSQIIKISNGKDVFLANPEMMSNVYETAENKIIPNNT